MGARTPRLQGSGDDDDGAAREAVIAAYRAQRGTRPQVGQATSTSLKELVR